MASKKQKMQTVIDGLFWSSRITEEAKEDFLIDFTEQDKFFESYWDKMCNNAAKELLGRLSKAL